MRVGGLLLLAHALLDDGHENSFLLCLLRSLCDLAANFLCFHSLDHTDGHSLPHVTHGKATWKYKTLVSDSLTENKVHVGSL